MDDYSNTLILARVSGKEQVEGYSLDSQHKLLQTYSANLNLNVIKVFQFAETASKEKSRKVFQEMMHFASLKNNKIYNIVVEKTDRYTRNFKDAVALDDWLEYDANRKLHAVKESLILHKNSKSRSNICGTLMLPRQRSLPTTCAKKR
jgi:DNA invertase Pin-like site-specific DNA recombinase